MVAALMEFGHFPILGGIRMADFFIVSSRKFKQHRSFEIADGERADLQSTARDGSVFRIYRCKSNMVAGGKFVAMETLLREALSDAPPSDWRSRALSLLGILDAGRAAE